MALDRFRPAASQKIDFWLMLLVLALLGFGLMMVSSASVVVAWKSFGSNSFFLVRQLWAALAGLVGLVAMTMIDYRVWQRLAPWLGGAIVILLILPFIPGLGYVAQGAQRWISVGGLSVQPSEFVKPLAVLYAAAWLAARADRMGEAMTTFWPFVIGLGALTFGILFQPDAGTALVLAMTVSLMYVVSGARVSHLIGLTAIGLLGFGLILLSPYRAQRFLTFLHPDDALLGAGYQINQSLVAIGSGGWTGLGFGQSVQKYLFLPEVQTDSIFAITTEELGFLRVLLVLIVFAIVAYRGFLIARRMVDPFGQLAAVGLTSLVSVQLLTNVGAMLGVLPLTGVTLPLISFGGSSLVATLMSFGILLSISKHVERSGRSGGE